MDQFDTLLRDGAERRKRSALRLKVVDDLRRSTKRNVIRAVLFFAASAFSFWRINAEFFVEELITRSDAAYLAFDVVICVSLFYAGIACIFRSPRDLALLDLLEQKTENENKEPNEAT